MRLNLQRTNLCGGSSPEIEAEPAPLHPEPVEFSESVREILAGSIARLTEIEGAAA